MVVIASAVVIILITSIILLFSFSIISLNLKVSLKFEQIICIYWFNLFFIPKHFHNLSACLLDFTLIWVLYALYFIFFNLKLKNWIACFALHLGYFFFKFIFTNFIWIINGKYQYSLSVKTDFQRFRIWEFEVEKIF